jgi:protein-glutamine gamma-glutamyltransferase
VLTSLRLAAVGRPALSALPRDARDTLFLLAVIAWVVLIQANHIPWWCSALSVLLLAWRGWLALHSRALPGWPWRVGLLILALAGTWFTHASLIGRDAGVTLIAVLLALKTMELRARRDAFVVFFLGFFTLLTHFFYSQSLLTALGILLALMGLLTALVNAHMPVGRPPLRLAARTATRLVVLGAPVMLVLFLLFPRMAPLWSMPDDTVRGRSGLSAQMRVGQVAEMALDDSIALRVRFDGPVPALSAMYFRGPVLTDFDGLEWRPLRSGFPARLALPHALAVQGEGVAHEITLEPHPHPWLFVLDASATGPERTDMRPHMTPELQWITDQAITSRVRYRATSHPRFQHGPPQSMLALQDMIALPPGFNPRTLALAQQLRAVHGPGPAAAPALVQAALERLRTGNYRYTLSPGRFGRHVADEFWFDRRQGFCEHIASSFVVLMRAMDIPARIVTGFQGGEFNPVDGFWTVRNRDAHAWAEVWLLGRGWVRVDPTSAVAPGRVNAFDRLRVPPGLIGAAWGQMDPDTAARLRQAWDAINNGWNQWVLNHSESRQMDLLRRVGFLNPGWADLALVLVGLGVALSLGGAAWTLWDRREHDPWLRLLARARRRMARLGLPAGEHLPPRRLAGLAQQRLGDTAFTRALTDWLLRLEALRYARTSPDSLVTLQRQFRQLEWPREGSR